MYTITKVICSFHYKLLTTEASSSHQQKEEVKVWFLEGKVLVQNYAPPIEQSESAYRFYFKIADVAIFSKKEKHSSLLVCAAKWSKKVKFQALDR